MSGDTSTVACFSLPHVMPVMFKNQCKDVRAPKSRAKVHFGRGGGNLCWCKCIKFMAPCSTLGMTCSQMETISLFHILLSVKYPHSNKLAERHSAAYRLFYHGKLFHFEVSAPCCEAPVTPVLPETSFFFFAFSH